MSATPWTIVRASLLIIAVANLIMENHALSAEATDAGFSLQAAPADPNRPKELLSLDDFSAATAKQWNFRQGSNVDLQADFDSHLVGSGQAYLRLAAERRNRSDRAPEHNWFRFDRAIKADDAWLQAEGLRLVLGIKQKGKWWLSLSAITDEGDTFNAILTPDEYEGGELTDRLLRFNQFASKSQPEKKLKPNRITGLFITGSATDNVLFLERLSLYAPARREGWLEFSTSAPNHNLLPRDAAVELVFKPQGAPPAGADGFRYELTDYYEAAAGSGEVKLVPEQAEYRQPAANLAPGYYEVRAYWLKADGQRLEEMSCLKATGSMPAGMGTFAVLPSTLGENVERSAKYKDQAFLGLHGDFTPPDDKTSVADLLGCTWRMGYSKWKWIEPQKPDRSAGPAEWAQKALAQEPRPAHLFHICTFRANLADKEDLPEWAAKPDCATQPAPGYADWNDFLALYRDTVKVEKHSYPHQSPRIYGGAWEVNLNMAPHYHAKPLYTPEDVVEIFKRVRPIVDAEDPGARLIGPCFSSIFNDLALHEPVFQAGLLQYLDGIECHAYHSPAPEQRDLPAKIRRFNEMVKKYNNGKQLPIYCTEMGYRANYGSVVKYREQAQWMVRACTIFKGEGWKAFLPFYISDYTHDEGWGILFNLELDKKPWGSKFHAPKPLAPALAVWIKALEGATPVRDLSFFGSDIWGYVFNRDGQPVVAAWTVEQPLAVRFAAGDTAALAVTDMMGRQNRVSVEAGFANLTLGPSPIYIEGLDPKLYLPAGGAEAVDLFAGEEKSVPVVENGKIEKVQAWGRIAAAVDPAAPGALHLQVPVAAPLTPEPLGLIVRDAAGTEKSIVRWLAVAPSVKTDSFELVLQEGKPAMRLVLENIGRTALPVKAQIRAEGELRVMPEISLAAGEKHEHVFALPFSGPVDPQRQVSVELTVAGGDARQLKSVKKVNFLAAHRRGEPAEGKLLNRAEISGPGSSGQTDRADLSFEWDDANLYLRVECHDDKFYQQLADANIWQQDSLQLAFDTHPEENLPYSPPASIFTKKITSVAFALTPKGPLAWRHQTHAESELALGECTGQFTPDIKRDEAAGVTTYDLTLPWKSLGMNPEWMVKGKPLGVSLLVNDSDGAGTPRQGIEFFSGIMRGKDFEQYGRMTLQ